MKNLKSLALVLILILTLGVLTGCGGSDSNDSADGGDGDKVTAKVVLVLEDQTEVPYDISVAGGQTLRDALNEAGLLSEESYYSMFVDEIDGHLADALNDGVMWLPCDKDGNQLEAEIDDETAFAMFDKLTVDDGDEFYLVYTVVPNFED